MEKSLVGSKHRTSHMDHIAMNEGVMFNVRYIGCVTVKKSMKQLDFQTRSQVAKECINRVCEAAALKSSKKRRVDTKILQCIDESVNLKHAGTNVNLTVSSSCLELVNADKRELIAKHDMPKISFASGGDPDTLDFVAYVAKDDKDWRACFVLECGGGQAQDLIATIGKAFEERYKEFVSKPPISLQPDKEYYNDLPEKMPPESSLLEEDPRRPLTVKKPRDRLSSNLIDLNSPTAEHEYVNDRTKDENSNNQASGLVRDVFDFNPLPQPLAPEVHKAQLSQVLWYHGPITRIESEILLKNDGDFLVRDSYGTRGQYVLSGMQKKTPKHLLLIDPEGIVRTKDRHFESIPDLIQYHHKNALPIISVESELLLKSPIPKK